MKDSITKMAASQTPVSFLVSRKLRNTATAPEDLWFNLNGVPMK